MFRFTFIIDLADWVAMAIAGISLLWNVVVYYSRIKSRLKIKIEQKHGIHDGFVYNVIITNTKYRERTVSDLYTIIKPTRFYDKLKSFLPQKTQIKNQVQEIILPFEIRIENSEYLIERIRGDGGRLIKELYISKSQMNKFVEKKKKLRIVVLDTHGKKHFSDWIKF